MLDKDAFLEDLRGMVTIVWTYEDFGDAGSSLSHEMEFQGDPKTLFERHPDATNDSLRRGSMIVGKELMAETRTRLAETSARSCKGRTGRGLYEVLG
jgi:hypothetical protein